MTYYFSKPVNGYLFMMMKTQFLFPVILLAALFISPCIVCADNGKDSELTYSLLLETSLKNGKFESTDKAIDVLLDGGSDAIDALTGREFKKLGEDDFIAFSFSLPKGAKMSEAKIQCISNDDVMGKARVRWNGQPLENLEFKGTGNFSETLTLYEPRQENNVLRITTTEGNAGIQSVRFQCEVPFPSWNYDGLIITQTAKTTAKFTFC